MLISLLDQSGHAICCDATIVIQLRSQIPGIGVEKVQQVFNGQSFPSTIKVMKNLKNLWKKTLKF
jgi:hypothetical protein